MVPILILIVVALVVFVFLNKKKVVNETPAITLNYKALLELHIPYYQHLDADRKLLFERKVAGLLADITIEGVGTTVSDADKVMIAASAQCCRQYHQARRRSLAGFEANY